MENELNEKDDSPLDCGGDIKECELLNDLGLNVECQSQITGTKMVDSKCIVKNFILENPRVLNPLNFNNDNDFLDSLWIWYVKTMKKTNIERYKEIGFLLAIPVSGWGVYENPVAQSKFLPTMGKPDAA